MKKLYRSRRDRKIFGVCGGLVDYFGIGVTIIRVIFLIAIFTPFPMIIAYIAGALIIPENPNEPYVVDEDNDRK